MDKLRKIVQEVLRESIFNEVVENVGYNVYHGSSDKIKKFSDDFVGGTEAIDHDGAGIYFATDLYDAAHYGIYVYSAYVEGRFLDENTPSNNVNKDDIVKLIKMKEDWELNAQDFAEDPEFGFEEAINITIQYNDTEVEVFQQIEADFYRYDSISYVRNMTKLGYDGIIVNAPSGEQGDKHIIVFNPDIIEFRGIVEDNGKDSDLDEAYVNDSGVLKDFDKRFEYPYEEIWNLIGRYVQENNRHWKTLGWGIFDAYGSDAINDKYKSNSSSVFKVEKIDELDNQMNKVLDYLSSDEEAYEKAIEVGFILDENGVVIGFGDKKLID